jgi:hypothetical protein
LLCQGQQHSVKRLLLWHFDGSEVSNKVLFRLS